MPVACGVENQEMDACVLSDIEEVQLVVDIFEALGGPFDGVSLERAECFPPALCSANNAR